MYLQSVCMLGVCIQECLHKYKHVRWAVSVDLYVTVTTAVSRGTLGSPTLHILRFYSASPNMQGKSLGEDGNRWESGVPTKESQPLGEHTNDVEVLICVFQIFLWTYALNEPSPLFI